jgi:hypothetical protein
MPSRTTRTESSVQVRLVNPREVPVQLVLEPWGESYTIPPDDVIDIKVRGPQGEALEIAHQPEAIVVWGWPGSTMRVFHGAKELGSIQGRPPVPGSPGTAEATDGGRAVKNGARRPGAASRARTTRPPAGSER